MNLVLLAGTIRQTPTSRQLPDGTDLAEIDLVARSEDGTTRTVPVTIIDPAPDLVDLQPDTPVVVVGSVRRRFYRSGGSTVSRTDVLATSVLPARRRASVKRTVETALAAVPPELRA